jgi:VWFA-related protein
MSDVFWAMRLLPGLPSRRWLLRRAFCNLPSWLAASVLVFAASWAGAQSGPPPGGSTVTATTQSASDNATAAEMSSRDEATTFKVNVKLVVMRVVVRDGQGHAVGNLHQEDFQLLDKGKPQTISQFSVEQPGVHAAKEEKTAEENLAGENPPATPAATGKPLSAPERFVAYLFDDEHLQFANLAQVRDAAQRHFKTLRPTDRAAVFTTSGKTMLDFTDDQTKLQDAILHLKPRLDTIAETNPCPDISYYMADLIVNKHDSDALRLGILDYINCSQLGASTFGLYSANVAPPAQRMAPQLVSSTAQQVLSKGDIETHLSLGILKDVVNRISRMPGQRIVILVSPGFLTPQMEYEYADIIDRAVHSQVLINAIDARGLYVIVPGGDASKRGIALDADPNETATIDPAVLKSQYQAHSAMDEADTLSSFAEGTGGTFFHNNNDFDEGFRRVAEAPAYSYVLGFSPQGLKLDGSFHTLAVKLNNPQKLSVQARRGYYAPKNIEDKAEQAKQEIQDAIFSQDELQDLPFVLRTRFFKASDTEAKITVLAHMDARRLHFRKSAGRNGDELTFASALFNQNGSFLQGTQKVVTLRLRDGTLAHMLNSGITMKTDFDVKPGSYLVRVVVRDAEGQLSAENGAVEIP